MSTKPIQDQSKALNQEQIAKNKKYGKRQGIAQKPIDEAIPSLEKAQTEKVISGQNNSLIILGRDRPGNLYSGFGGRGATQASRIDLIAGMAATYRHKDGTYSPPNEDTLINPNFAMDAARVYITQKGDIDRYMALAEVPRQASNGKSAIGLKADAIRIHSRDDIKIVTGRSNFQNLGKTGERLSNGGKNEVVGTISLIAGNNTGLEDLSIFDIFRPFGRKTDTRNKLQPIPKGENLSECLEDIVVAIEKLSALVGDNTHMIQQIDAGLVSHFHGCPTGITSTPTNYFSSPIVQSTVVDSFESRQIFNKNLGAIKFNYLDATFGSDYINSQHVFTT